jgi:hypothetical protein
MDKVAQYQQSIINVLNEQPALIHQSADEDVRTRPLYDLVHHQYMLYRLGWMGKTRVSSVLVYVRLENGKIWIEEDWTEAGIAADLIQAGVPPEEIVLGFRHPLVRPLTEFAMA